MASELQKVQPFSSFPFRFRSWEKRQHFAVRSIERLLPIVFSLRMPSFLLSKILNNKSSISPMELLSSKFLSLLPISREDLFWRSREERFLSLLPPTPRPRRRHRQRHLPRGRRWCERDEFLIYEVIRLASKIFSDLIDHSRGRHFGSRQPESAFCFLRDIPSASPPFTFSFSTPFLILSLSLSLDRSFISLSLLKGFFVLWSEGCYSLKLLFLPPFPSHHSSLLKGSV